jgi:hypothetical protein
MVEPWVLVEAAGVELFRVLITRNLLILGSATTANKAPLLDPLYVYCTKCFSLWSATGTAWRPQYRIDSQRWIEKAASLPWHRKTVPCSPQFPKRQTVLTLGLPQPGNLYFTLL